MEDGANFIGHLLTKLNIKRNVNLYFEYILIIMANFAIKTYTGYSKVTDFPSLWNYL